MTAHMKSVDIMCKQDVKSKSMIKKIPKIMQYIQPSMTLNARQLQNKTCFLVQSFFKLNRKDQQL